MKCERCRFWMVYTWEDRWWDLRAGGEFSTRTCGKAWIGTDTHAWEGCAYGRTAWFHLLWGWCVLNTWDPAVRWVRELKGR